MYKRISTASMALVALAAFVLPATASATSPELNNSSGSTLANGTSLGFSNIGNTVFKGAFGELGCSTVDMTGTVSSNPGNGSPVQITINTVSFTGTDVTKDCTSGLGAVKFTTSGAFNGTPWCLSLRGGDELQIRGNSCDKAARSITFVLDFTSGFSCAYERTTVTGPIKGTYSTAPSDAEGAIATGANSEFKLESGQPFLCPASGSLEMKFKIELGGGGTTVIL